MADTAIPQTKICSKCRQWRPISEFCIDKTRPDGRSYVCFFCRRDHRIANREQIAFKKKIWGTAYRAANVEKERLRSAKYQIENKEKIARRTKSYRAANPEKIRARVKKFKERRPTYRAEATALWRQRHPERAKELSRASSAKHRSTIKGKLEKSILEGVRKGITVGSKGSHRTFDLLGYTVEALIAHLENNFLPGMTWQNYGRHGWHVDHRIPLAAHNYETPFDADFKRAWALSNLQPLWALDNLRKHAKLEAPFQPSLAF